MHETNAAKRDLKRAPINKYLLMSAWFLLLVLALGMGAVLGRPEIFGQLTQGDAGPAAGLGNLGAELGAVAVLSMVAGVAVGAVFIACRRMERLEAKRIYPLQ